MNKFILSLSNFKFCLKPVSQCVLWNQSYSFYRKNKMPWSFFLLFLYVFVKHYFIRITYKFAKTTPHLYCTYVWWHHIRHKGKDQCTCICIAFAFFPFFIYSKFVFIFLFFWRGLQPQQNVSVHCTSWLHSPKIKHAEVVCEDDQTRLEWSDFIINQSEKLKCIWQSLLLPFAFTLWPKAVSIAA